MLRSWRLYSWMRLICTSNIADRIDRSPLSSWMRGQRFLVAAPDRRIALHEVRIVGKALEPGELVRIVEHALAERAR